MASFNQLTCNIGGGNLGIGRCDLKEAPTAALIAHPDGTFLTATDFVNIQAALQGKIRANVYTDRWQIITGINDSENAGEDPQYFTYANGDRVLTRDRKFGKNYSVDNRCLHVALIGWRGRSTRLMRIDKNGNLWGAYTVDANNATAFQGALTSRFYAEDAVLADYSNPERYMLNVEYADPSEFGANRTVVPKDQLFGGNGQPNYNLFNLARFAVQNVTLSNATPTGATSGVFTIVPEAGCGQLNMAKQFAATLAAPSLWVASNAQTGGAITITSVALNSAGTGYVLTLDTTDPDYPATGYINIAFASVSTLVTAGIETYEAFTLKIPRS